MITRLQKIPKRYFFGFFKKKKEMKVYKLDLDESKEIVDRGSFRNAKRELTK